MRYGIIWAQDCAGGIGLNGGIPWRNTPEGKKDMMYFKRTTAGCILIAGRATAESFGWSLPGRIILVVSSRELPDCARSLGAARVESLEAALGWASQIPAPDIPESTPPHYREYVQPQDDIRVWVVGGVGLYEEALARRDYSRLSITYIPGDYGCDRKIKWPTA